MKWLLKSTLLENHLGDLDEIKTGGTSESASIAGTIPRVSHSSRFLRECELIFAKSEKNEFLAQSCADIIANCDETRSTTPNFCSPHRRETCWPICVWIFNSLSRRVSPLTGSRIWKIKSVKNRDFRFGRVPCRHISSELKLFVTGV